MSATRVEPELTIRPAQEADTPLLLRFIRDLADFEKLADEVVATEQGLRETMFGERRHAEALLAFHGDQPSGFALPSTTGKPSLQHAPASR